ncbi:Fe2+-enterobactin ABC transporter substrate-binding protein [Glutamicibacter halophytocola]|uniref:Fe2+-enterobactin ABC transporter substrate-binding protein n=1 Tax=Glutamicibacter halophytocola TaxID=1933880 RepID=UPI0015C5551F|nr:Fe2+-enterobactin ABC transporter substrate-binding protein [Glutamicibacter halophytocola]
MEQATTKERIQVRFNLRTIASTSVAAALMLGLGACTASGSATPETSDTQSSATQQSQWPRTITDEKGSVTIEEQPKRIVNTAMSTTGSLLAIDAPVAATTVTTPGPEADSNGFFTQWSEAAAAANVQPLYKIGNFDLESIIAQDPDLIVVSTSGADSVMDHYDQLKEIAPTIVVNYSNKDWPELTRQLAAATGHEAEAEKIISEFDERAAQVKEKLAIPSGTTASIVSYNKGSASPVGKTTGPHSRLITALGFEVVEPPEEYNTNPQKRDDFVFTSYEGLAKSATGDATFLIAATEDTAKSFLSDPTLANLPSVKSKNVFPLANSFRLDYYSSSQILDYFENDFPSLAK